MMDRTNMHPYCRVLYMSEKRLKRFVFIALGTKYFYLCHKTKDRRLCDNSLYITTTPLRGR